MGNIYEQKLAMTDSFRVFGGSYPSPPPKILTNHYIKETVSKRNIWGSFSIPKGEGLDGL